MKHNTHCETATTAFAVVLVLAAIVGILGTVTQAWGKDSPNHTLITRPGGMEGLHQIRFITCDATTPEDAIACVDKVGGWAEADVVQFDPMACGKDSARECSDALEAACAVVGSEVTKVEFAIGNKCTGECANGSQVLVECARPTFSSAE